MESSSATIQTHVSTASIDVTINEFQKLRLFGCMAGLHADGDMSKPCTVVRGPVLGNAETGKWTVLVLPYGHGVHDGKIFIGIEPGAQADKRRKLLFSVLVMDGKGNVVETCSLREMVCAVPSSQPDRGQFLFHSREQTEQELPRLLVNGALKLRVQIETLREVCTAYDAADVATQPETAIDSPIKLAAEGKPLAKIVHSAGKNGLSTSKTKPHNRSPHIKKEDFKLVLCSGKGTSSKSRLAKRPTQALTKKGHCDVSKKTGSGKSTGKECLKDLTKRSASGSSTAKNSEKGVARISKTTKVKSAGSKTPSRNNSKKKNGKHYTGQETPPWSTCRW
eukprot:GHVT01004133.1.p1 GENE.GHVT01004133.1~~GHVT01004133.1.p1  ORF type:complete len:336 (-),score=38.82 GHVT01004133.1:586-1593(-)